MKIQFCGATRTVTGSQYLLEINGYRILLECGLYQGKRNESMQKNRTLPFDASRVDLLVLSHAHIDHSGNVPNLVKNGFKGDILCTYATRDLCTILLRDSANIQLADIEYINKKRAKEGLPPVEPIYTLEDALQSLQYFIGLGYERPREILPGVELCFHDAGHILGSAIVSLHIEDKKQKKTHRLVFSGDLGRPDVPILKDPCFMEEADILLIESTYGDREHGPKQEIDQHLAQIVNDTVKIGGKVIIPAFAVGRTQEIVYRLHQLTKDRIIPHKIPIFVDSPLAINATSIYRLHPEAFDKETTQFLLDDKHGDIFGFDLVQYTRSVDQSKAINNFSGPAIIISASGMAEAGRILHHLKNNIEDARNTILMVGWQAPDTLGRRLLEKLPRVKIFGEEYINRARVEKLDGLSAHADAKVLLQWADTFKKKPAHTYVIHGEEEASLALASGLKKIGYKQVSVPHPGDVADI